MALTDFKYERDHARALYNAKGDTFWCHSKEDELRGKEQGFTTFNYVRSAWPKTAFHQKTGQTKPVGKLADTEEQNKAAVAALGPDWSLEYKAVPEKVEEAPKTSSGDMTALLSLFAQQQAQIAELQAAVLASVDAKGPGKKKAETVA